MFSFICIYMTLSNFQEVAELGEVLVSLSYLPTAERLTLVVMKARDLRVPTTTPSSGITWNYGHDFRYNVFKKVLFSIYYTYSMYIHVFKLLLEIAIMYFADCLFAGSQN